MTVAHYIWTSLIAFGIFIVVDLLWLGVVAQKMYDHYIGSFLRENFLVVPALIFYAFFIVGLVYFVIAPAVANGSVFQAFGNGALLGALAYATYEVTNYSVIKDWPLPIVFIDIAWGAVLTSVVSGATFFIVTRVLNF